MSSTPTATERLSQTAETAEVRCETQFPAAGPPAECNGTPEPADFDESLWTGDERSYRQVMRATRLYSDPSWRTQNFPRKKRQPPSSASATRSFVGAA